MTFILTLRLDPTSQEHFNRQRERYFPPAINYIDAHVTLFHLLPEEAWVTAAVAAAASAQAAFPIAVNGLRSLGRGVAYTLDSPVLLGLHARLAKVFAKELTAQDRQRFLPHVVVQNKVTPEAARAVLGELRTGFVPRQVAATGLSLWQYHGGPWEPAESFGWGS